MAAVTNNATVHQGTDGDAAFVVFDLSIAADADTFASGVQGYLYHMIECVTADLTRGPIATVSSGTFTFDVSAAARIFLKIYYKG